MGSEGKPVLLDLDAHRLLRIAAAMEGVTLREFMSRAVTDAAERVIEAHSVEP